MDNYDDDDDFFDLYKRVHRDSNMDYWDKRPVSVHVFDGDEDVSEEHLTPIEEEYVYSENKRPKPPAKRVSSASDSVDSIENQIEAKERELEQLRAKREDVKDKALEDLKSENQALKDKLAKADSSGELKKALATLSWELGQLMQSTEPDPNDVEAWAYRDGYNEVINIIMGKISELSGETGESVDPIPEQYSPSSKQLPDEVLEEILRGSSYPDDDFDDLLSQPF